MKRKPPPLPGTWQHYTLAGLGFVIAALLFCLEAIGDIAYGIGLIALFCVAWPIVIPYLIIKHAVASGVRAGRGEE